MRPVIFDCLWGGEGEDFGKITWFSVGTEETLNVSRRQQSMKGGRGGEGGYRELIVSPLPMKGRQNKSTEPNGGIT